VLLVPLAHVAPLQQPEHEVGSHAQAPSTQRWPAAQAPCVHTPLQPSDAPHALPAQLGLHGPVPQTPGPPPPQVWPALHPPQSVSLPQRSKI
jgi:hypothetical protein